MKRDRCERRAGGYLRVIARVVPPAMLLQREEDTLRGLSDDELATYLAAVRAALAVRDEAA